MSRLYHKSSGPVAQLVASSTKEPGVASSIPAPHAFLQIDHEIISMVILLPTLRQEGLMSVSSENMRMIFWLNA